MDENTAQLVERCNRLLVVAKAKQSAGDVAEAQRLLEEALRCAGETARASGTGLTAVFVPETLDDLVSWELQAPDSTDR